MKYTVFYHYDDNRVSHENFDYIATALYNAGEINNPSIIRTRVVDFNGQPIAGFNWPGSPRFAPVRPGPADGPADGPPRSAPVRPGPPRFAPVRPGSPRSG